MCLFAASLSTARLGHLICQKNGWKAGFLVFLSAPFLLEFLKFETEAFAYPLLFLSLSFVLEKGWKNKAAALALASTATLIWPGSAIYFIAFIPYMLPLVFPVVAAAAAFPSKALFLLSRLAPSSANESAWLGGGIAFQGGLMLGIYGFFSKKARKLLPLAVFFGALAFTNPKFTALLSPVLAASLATGIQEFKWLKPLAYGVLAGMLAFSPIVVATLYDPTQADVSIVKAAVMEAQGETIYNDWSTGHMIEYYGGNPRNKAGGTSHFDCPGPCLVLTRKPPSGCKAMAVEPGSRGLRLYDCPTSPHQA